jgi:hypothetical protein
MPLFTFHPANLDPNAYVRLRTAQSEGDGTMSRAGRPQKPLPDGPAAAVSAELRRLRERAGLTYRELADDSGFSLATVTAACGGRRLPTWQVTRACVVACGGDQGVMRGLYERACAAAGRQVPTLEPGVTDPPDPAEAATPAQFVAGLALLRAWAGTPSLATLNERSGGHLPPSTISGALRRQSLPRLDLVIRYARACGLPEPAVGDWEKAWKTIKAPERPATGRAALDRESHLGVQPAARAARPSPPRIRAASVIALLMALVNALILIATGTSSPSPQAAAGLVPTGQPMMVTLQLSGAHYVVQLGAEWGSQHDAYLEALDLEGSGTLSTTALTLGGLPVGTAVGFLSGAGRSLRSCGAARWYIASSMPLIPDSTVCIFRPAKPGLAILLSIQQRSAQAIALDVNSWYPGSRPGATQPSASGADLAASSS